MIELYVRPVLKLGRIIAPSGFIIDSSGTRINSKLIYSGHSLGGPSTCSCETSGGKRKCNLEGAESPLQLPTTSGPPAAPEVATHFVPRTRRPLGLSGTCTGHGLSGKSRGKLSFTRFSCKSGYSYLRHLSCRLQRYWHYRYHAMLRHSKSSLCFCKYLLCQ